MDNTRDLPGYKYFVDATTGERPAVFVAFIDLAADSQSSVNGVVFPVHDEAQLAQLDARERNYERREVTAQVHPPITGTVWAYFGTAAARERFERGRAAGTAVVSRGYRDGVRGGYANLGAEELARFEASTDDPGLPIRDFKRVDLPALD